jgi:uncharacterized SAM-binding protein YcdF (DUF218 family)
MATWHQQQAPVRLYHPAQWTVVIDPPHMMRALHTFSTQAMAAQYMRSLRANNPHAAKHSYILKPARR